MSAGHEEHCPDINGPACAERPVDAQFHSLGLGFGELRLRADYGLTSWLAVDVQAGLRVVYVDFELQDAARRKPIDQPYGKEIHHRSETLVGPTDPWLGLRAVRPVGRWRFGFRGGVTLPAGSTVENPFRLGREGRAHQHIQFGTGTLDPFLEVEAAWASPRVELAGWLLAKTSLYENRHGYRGGSRLWAGVRARSRLGLRRWTFGLGALAYHEQPERWDGLVETEGNLGRTDLIAEVEAALRIGDWVTSIGVRAPVWSRAVGAQLTTPAYGEVAAGRAFQLVGR